MSEEKKQEYLKNMLVEVYKKVYSSKEITTNEIIQDLTLIIKQLKNNS